jgi:TonB-linked SusC/RagA family outer membrane protein
MLLKVLSLLAIGLICPVLNGYASDMKTFAGEPFDKQQTRITVKGKVVDLHGEPLVGVSVTVKGTTQGVLTDIDGRYSINSTSGVTLIFSYIGYKSQSVNLANQSEINITLEEDAQIMQEVVVVGYGSQKKESLTGAVASIKVSDAIDSRPVADVSRGLQGLSPGLSVRIPSGEIGSDAVIKIRGQISSIQGNSNPLILLDNVEIPSLQLVNPDDIESISVLKDAASASIYGAKGASGVILITSKKGAKTEGVTVSYTGNLAWQNPAKDAKMGGLDAMEYSYEAMKRVNGTVTGGFWLITEESFKKAQEWQQKYAGVVGKNDPMVYGRDWYYDGKYKLGLRTYDPYDYMIREWAPSTDHKISVAGKTAKTTYNVGLNYLSQEGLNKPAKEDNFKRYTASLQLSTEVNKYLTFRAGAMYSDRNKRYANSTYSTTADQWLYIYRWGPIFPWVEEDGVPTRNSATELAQSNIGSLRNEYLSVNVGATVNITKNWTANFDYTYSGNTYSINQPGTRFTAKNTWVAPQAKLDSNGNQIYVNSAGEQVSSTDSGAMPAYQLPTETYTAAGASPDLILQQTQKTRQNTINAYTTYDTRLNEVHSIKAMLGINRVTNEEAGHWSQIKELLDITNPQFNTALGTQNAGGNANWESQLGYFGRLNYSFMDKYLVEGNLRYDGSSKFPSGMKWRWFPSFSAGWILSEENFLSWSKSFLSHAKLRGSYGTIGDQTVSNSLYISTMPSGQLSWIGGSGTKVPYVGTPAAVYDEIYWQDISTTDIGLDLRFLNNKMGLTVDWYRRETKNMIVPMEGIPATYGSGAPQGNFGSLRTDGWEVSYDFAHRFSNGLNISLNANFSDAVTKIVSYGTSELVNGYYNGKTYGEIWGYKVDRLFQKDDFELDANGNPIEYTLTAADSEKYAGKKVYKMKSKDGKKPIYQPFLQNSSNFYFGPGDVKFLDLNGDGEINNGDASLKDHGDLAVIGNTTPRYEYSFRLAADYKGFDLSVFFQGVGKREMWGEGFLAQAGYNSSDGAMPQAMAGDFWRENRTNAFYPRPFNNGATNTVNNMQVSDRYLLNMAYLRLKNITFGYTLPLNLLKKAYMTKARVYLSLENMLTFDHLGDLPIDPEEVSGYSMWNSSNYNSSRTGVGAPAFKTVSVGVQLNF